MKVVISILIAIMGIVLLPSLVLAEDFCQGAWPAKVSDGQTATDYRFQHNNPYSEWPETMKYIGTHEPIPIEFPESPKATPVVVKYDAPPQLDMVQATRWGQATPWVKVRLAVLYDIPKETAIKYGAKY